MDYFLLAVAMALVAYGALIIYLATRDDPLPTPTYYLRYQLIFAGVGLAAGAVITLIDYERYRRWQWLLYGFAVFCIGAVFALATVTRGSRRWIDLGFFNFQPSELAIWIIAVSLGAFLVDRLDSLGSRRLTLMAVTYVSLPALMVFLQPDLGTAAVLLALGLGLLLFFGTRWTHFAAIGAGLACVAALVLTALPAVGVHLVKPYQLERLTVFLDPSHDTSTAGYNLAQSLIAVGSGGLTGRGAMATQTQLQFLPEHHTDFIFAVISERWGFAGAAGLIVLYALLVWRALRIATMARDMYGSVIAGGIASVFLFQVLVNVGMTLGIMPVTGIPLPFISYGGAALITNLMLVGLLESIHIRASDALAARERVG
jgi:rod shape determining protein RodA